MSIQHDLSRLLNIIECELVINLIKKLLDAMEAAILLSWNKWPQLSCVHFFAVSIYFAFSLRPFKHGHFLLLRLGVIVGWCRDRRVTRCRTSRSDESNWKLMWAGHCISLFAVVQSDCVERQRLERAGTFHHHLSHNHFASVGQGVSQVVATL